MNIKIFILVIISSCLWAQVPDTYWIANYSGPDSIENWPVKLITDPLNNIIITGVQYSKTGRRDMVILKYSPDGTLLWSDVYDGPANYTDEPSNLVIDAYNYIYVAGQSKGMQGLSECNGIVILKYHPTGELAWVKRYDEQVGSSVYVQGFAVDSKRNIICTTKLVEGQTLTMNEIITRKLYSTGEFTWEESFPVHRWSECFGITCDNFGNIFLGGWIWDGSGNSDYEFFSLLKYSDAGSLLWFSPYRDSSAWSANSRIFKNDGNGNFFVVGDIEKITREEFFVTAKYDKDGGILWHREFQAVDDPEIMDISTDKFGNVYWLAEDDNDSTYDIIIAKYLANGDSVWVRYISDKSPTPYALAIDEKENVYILSRVWSGDSKYGLSIIKLKSDGKTLWTYLVEDEISYHEYKNIALDKQNNIILTTDWEDVSGIKFIKTLKLSQSGSTSANTKSQDLIIPAFKLEQNYPNPFNPITKIEYSIPKEGLVTIKIYNVIGEEVVSLVNEEKSAGVYEINFNASSLPSGVYFYQMKAGSFVQTKKMVLMK